MAKAVQEDKVIEELTDIILKDNFERLVFVLKNPEEIYIVNYDAENNLVEYDSDIDIINKKSNKENIIKKLESYVMSSNEIICRRRKKDITYKLYSGKKKKNIGYDTKIFKRYSK